MSTPNNPKQNDGIYHAPNIRVDPFPALANSTMGGITAPIHPPHRFNDDTLMYVAVRIGTEHMKASSEKASSVSSSSSRSRNKLKSLSNSLKRRTSCSSSSGTENIRVIRMPRSSYIQHFARNEADEYVGTEPERIWNDERLEEAFGRYRDFKPTKWVREERRDGGSGGGAGFALVPGKEVFAAAEGEGGDAGRLVKEG